MEIPAARRAGYCRDHGSGAEKHPLGKERFFIRESYKTLRTNVTFSLADETACKVLIVTSAMQSEGKSITALNLAISYAEMKQRVLLIDCDLRRPKLARLLSAKEKVGLSNLLIQPELLGKAIHDSGIEDLDVIFAGDVPPNPSELLGSSRMKALLDTCRKTTITSFSIHLPSIW